MPTSHVSDHEDFDLSLIIYSHTASLDVFMTDTLVIQYTVFVPRKNLTPSQDHFLTCIYALTSTLGGAPLPCQRITSLSSSRLYSVSENTREFAPRSLHTQPVDYALATSHHLTFLGAIWFDFTNCCRFISSPDPSVSPILFFNCLGCDFVMYLSIPSS